MRILGFLFSHIKKNKIVSHRDIVQRIYDATHGGLYIILWVCPQTSECVGVNGKKYFKMHDGNTPSARLLQRKSDKYGNIWGVMDYSGEGWRSAIDLYMEEHRFSQDRFNDALRQIAKHFNIPLNKEGGAL